MQSRLVERSNNKCEICQSREPLSAFFIPESPDTTANCYVFICQVCLSNIDAKGDCDLQHFRCLTNSMWSSTAAVQVMSYRLLHQCLPELWAQDAIDMLYLEEEFLLWAQADLAAEKEPTLDANGVALQPGDAVTVMKDLEVKGALLLNAEPTFGILVYLKTLCILKVK
jgi:protein PhnA